MSDMEVTTVLEPEGTGQMFDAGDYAFADFGILDNVHKFSLGRDF